MLFYFTQFLIISRLNVRQKSLIKTLFLSVIRKTRPFLVLDKGIVSAALPLLIISDFAELDIALAKLESHFAVMRLVFLTAKRSRVPTAD